MRPITIMIIIILRIEVYCARSNQPELPELNVTGSLHQWLDNSALAWELMMATSFCNNNNPITNYDDEFSDL